MSFVVGVPGAPPRLIIDASADRATDQLRDGEVLFEADVPAGRWLIDTAGTGLVPAPPPPEPPAPPSRYTFNQWVDLFPFAEQIAIVQATAADPVAKLIYDRALSASGSIDPADPRTVDGLRYLVSQGYVSQATLESITGV